MSALAHHHHHHTHGWITDRVLTWLGTFLVAVPLLIGLAFAAMALVGNRFGGAGNSFTALWYFALIASPAGVLGAVLLLVALRVHWSQRRPAVLWSAVMLAGLAGALLLPVLTGMATDQDALAGMARTLFDIASTAFVLAYLIGLAAMVAVGIRHLREHDRRRVG